MRTLRESDVVGPDELILAAGRVAIGRFRCPVTHPRFRDSGPIQNFLVVFPRNGDPTLHSVTIPPEASGNSIALGCGASLTTCQLTLNGSTANQSLASTDFTMMA